MSCDEKKAAWKAAPVEGEEEGGKGEKVESLLSLGRGEEAHSPSSEGKCPRDRFIKGRRGGEEKGGGHSIIIMKEKGKGGKKEGQRLSHDGAYGEKLFGGRKKKKRGGRKPFFTLTEGEGKGRKKGTNFPGEKGGVLNNRKGRGVSSPKGENIRMTTKG